MFKREYAWLGFVLALGLLVGCSDDDPAVLPDATEDSFATAGSALDAFVGAYREMSVAKLSAVLHPDFALLLQPDTINEFPLVGGLIDRGGQLRAAGRMFSGLDVTSPSHGRLAAISSLDVRLFEQREPWAEVAPGERFAGHQFALFEIEVVASRPGSSLLRSRGLLMIYMARTDSVQDGIVSTRWQMIGINDLTEGTLKSSEETKWGALQALYWTVE